MADPTHGEQSPEKPASIADHQALDLLVQRRYDRLRVLATKVRWRNAKSSLTANTLLNGAYIRLSKNLRISTRRDHHP